MLDNKVINDKKELTNENKTEKKGQERSTRVQRRPHIPYMVPPFVIPYPVYQQQPYPQQPMYQQQNPQGCPNCQGLPQQPQPYPYYYPYPNVMSQQNPQYNGVNPQPYFIPQQHMIPGEYYNPYPQYDGVNEFYQPQAPLTKQQIAERAALNALNDYNNQVSHIQDENGEVKKLSRREVKLLAKEEKKKAKKMRKANKKDQLNYINPEYVENNDLLVPQQVGHKKRRGFLSVIGKIIITLLIILLILAVALGVFYFFYDNVKGQGNYFTKPILKWIGEFYEWVGNTWNFIFKK